MDANQSSFNDLVDFQEQQGAICPQQHTSKAAQEPPTGGEELLQRFEKFVEAVTQDTMAEVLLQPKFWRLVDDLCKKAPQAVERVGPGIIKIARNSDRCIDATEQEAAKASMPGHGIPQSRKRRVEGSSYRPKRAKTGADTDNSFPLSENVEIRRSARLAGESLLDVTKPTSANTKGDECGELEETNSTARHDPPLSEGTMTPNDARNPTSEVHFSQFKSKQSSSRLASVEFSSAVQFEPPQSPNSSAPMPSIPAQIEAGTVASSRTEEIHTDNTPTSLGNVLSSPVSHRAAGDARTMIDHILEAVRIIHHMSFYPDSMPRQVHKSILQALRDSRNNTTSSSDWSTGSMWMSILEAGSAANQKITILNMLEYMGAWEWYDSQVRLVQASGKARTTRGKPMDRKGATTYFLNNVQHSGHIKSMGTLALEEGGAIDSTNTRDPVAERNRKMQRKRLISQLCRGQKLNDTLVKKLGFGILFDRKIWDYTKKGTEQLSLTIELIQADSSRMKLLGILSQQFERFILEGRPDIRSFYKTLTEEGLVLEHEYEEILSQYPLEPEPLSKDALTAAVAHLKSNISVNVLEKELEDSDVVTIRGGIEFSCDMFDKLLPDKWLDAWLLLAAMRMMDKPSFVRYNYSIPLGNIKHSKARRKKTCVSTPFSGWRRKIESFKKEVRGENGASVHLIYFSPLNLNSNHFTLLEINEQDEKIYHYDSMADNDIIDGTLEPTPVQELVQAEFGHLNFAYVEAPTPQQNDTASCGPMVVRNARLRMNGFPVGGWCDQLDPQRLRMDIVEAFQTCVLDNALWRKIGRVDS